MRASGYRIAGTCLLLVACQDQPTRPSDTPPEVAERASAGASQSIRDEEAELHRLAREIPGFGGHYYDEAGNLVA